jgi:hypothetical protein
MQLNDVSFGRSGPLVSAIGAFARRTTISLLRPLGVAALCLGVSACAPEGGSVTLSPAKGAPVERSLRDFAIAVATAQTIDDYCRSSGVRKAFSNPDQLSYDYARKLRAQGYTQAEIGAAANRLAASNAADLAIKQLQARGVREGDVASLCRYGKEEVARGSTVGQLLRVTK